MKQRFSDDTGSSTTTTDAVGRRSSLGGRRQAGGPFSALDGMLKSNAAAFTFLGLTLGVFVSRKFLILPVAVLTSLAQEGIVHAFGGQPRRRRNA